MTVRTVAKEDLLRWGRETAGLSVADAARRASIAPDRLERWEAGEAKPTITQLRKLAHIYRRPLSVFFLPERPHEPAEEVHDFRRLPGDGVPEISPALRYHLRLARERRNIALDLMNELGEEPHDFGVVATLDDEPEEVGRRIRARLGIEIETQAAWRNPYNALNAWRSAAESSGVFVFQASGIPVEEFRGFSLAEEPLPVIVINPKDAPAGRVFTMFHEMCHVALRRSGICEPVEERVRPPEEQRVEVFCNYVAGAALVPLQALLSHPVVAQQDDSEWSEANLASMARHFAVSKHVVLRRLLVAGRTSQRFYREKYREWGGWSDSPAEQANALVPPYRRAVSAAGPSFVRLVLRSYYGEHLTLSDVSKFLGVKLKHLPKIEQAVGF